MESAKKSVFLYVCLYVCFSMIGCATTKSTWTSEPPLQKEENAIFDIAFYPLKDGHDFFVKFRLDLTNKSDDVLKIDWNKTKYIHNGRAKGVFVFEGIDPADVRNRTVLDDVIDARSDFSKVIMPYKLVAWTPLRTHTSEKSISAGMLPNGENGIHLVIKHKGIEIIKELSVVIEKSVIE
jgi:hypothetical protein